MRMEAIAVGLRQASAMLGISRRQVQNFVRAKILRSSKIGRRRLIRVADIEHFVRRDQPTPAKKVVTKRGSR
ncbi:MAG: helix-turn-helix domain-containing protein [Candidatus Acidiferrales bacterium]